MLEKLAALGGGEIVVRRSEALLIATVLRFVAGRQVLAVERTYRFGVKVIPDPSAADVDTVASGDLRELWNSERAECVDFVV